MFHLTRTTFLYFFSGVLRSCYHQSPHNFVLPADAAPSSSHCPQATRALSPEVGHSTLSGRPLLGVTPPSLRKRPSAPSESGLTIRPPVRLQRSDRWAYRATAPPHELDDISGPTVGGRISVGRSERAVFGRSVGGVGPISGWCWADQWAVFGGSVLCFRWASRMFSAGQSFAFGRSVVCVLSVSGSVCDWSMRRCSVGSSPDG